MDFKIVPINEIVHSRYSADYSRSYSRETFMELVKSIKAIGVHDPLLVTGKNTEGYYVIIDGDHRLEAARKAGIEMIPLYIDSTIDPDKPSSGEDVLNYIQDALSRRGFLAKLQDYEPVNFWKNDLPVPPEENSAG